MTFYQSNKRRYLTFSITIAKLILTLVCLSTIISCQKKDTLFQLLSPAKTGIHFKNELIEDEVNNILNFTNLYTGAGLGIGDFNKDGWPDIFFGGNMESSRLYLNNGNFEFKDITISAGLETDRWITGVAVVDINTDGWDDIYLCVSGNATLEKQKNLLFINNQNNTFTESSQSYGLDDPAQCTHANFFDYDKDGDLDLFLIVNPTDYKLFNVNNIRKRKLNGEAPSTDKLYENRLNENNFEKPFIDVSKNAGILAEGYSLGINICDLNQDGWSDIYITNDFLTNDLIYINNQNGTFSNKADEILKHSSFASMGIDIADINNDALLDIYVLDMFPEDNFRQKMIMGADNYDRFQYMLKMGYAPQYSRNTLQINNGLKSNGIPSFSEIGQMAKVHKTDWSWSPLLADFDNDGFRDLYVSNGFRRDLGDLDYINYNNKNPFGKPDARKQDQLSRIKQQAGLKIPNYIFKNDNGLAFSKKSKEWGIDQASYSHGAAYVDLDLDGDLDLVTSNVAQEAFIYENKAEKLEHNYLKIQLLPNKHFSSTPFGTKIWLYIQDQVQYADFTPYRGYQSSVEASLHFGLGNATIVDSIKIQWPNGQDTLLKEISSKQNLKIEYPPKTNSSYPIKDSQVKNKLFVPYKPFENYLHKEDPFVDFKYQFLLPRKHSENGPPLCVGDLNNDGLEDAFIGGSAGYSGTFLIQKKDGTFYTLALGLDIEQEDSDALFFDYDQDGDLDLYVVSGGVVYSNKEAFYQDRIYTNKEGQFEKDTTALPKMPASGSCVSACDFDQDGDLDLFVGTRLVPHQYPLRPKSYLLENIGGRFKDITTNDLSRIGMVSTALWSDFDGDLDMDLILAGEFMPISFFENKEGIISNKPIIVESSNGWWNTLKAGDFDQDGDIDYLAGNLGLNSNLKASKAYPLRIYANDFDKNGSIDPILCQFINGQEYPTISRDKLISQIPSLKNRFNTYKKYALADFSSLFLKEEKEGMQVLEAYYLEHVFIENRNGKTFQMHPLSLELQTAPINDFLVEDFNEDGHLDALVIGNDYATEVGIGRYDAFIGALMLGKGDGSFIIQNGVQSGFLASKNAKSIVKLKLANGQPLILVSNNKDSLQGFIPQEEIKRFAVFN